MHLEGPILLGTGGDDSNGSDGSFFEGVITSGVAQRPADNAVQANIVSAGYGGHPDVPGSGTDYTITNVNNAPRSPPIRLSTANGAEVDIGRRRHHLPAVGLHQPGNGRYTITNETAARCSTRWTAGSSTAR